MPSQPKTGSSGIPIANGNHDQTVDGVGEALLRVDERVVRDLDGRGQIRRRPQLVALVFLGSLDLGDRDIFTRHIVVGRPGPALAAFDLVAQLDQRQLAAGDLLGQTPALLRVLDLHQLVGMGQAVLAQRHQLANLRRGVGEA